MQRWLKPGPKIRTWILFAWWTIMYLLTHLPGIDQWKPKGGWPVSDPDDYVHFALFVTWACLWVWVLAGHGHRLTRTSWTWLLVGVAFYAAFDEITQGIVGRTPDVADWILDITGCTLGLALSQFWQTRRLRAAEAGMGPDRHG